MEHPQSISLIHIERIHYSPESVNVQVDRNHVIGSMWTGFAGNKSGKFSLSQVRFSKQTLLNGRRSSKLSQLMEIVVMDVKYSHRLSGLHRALVVEVNSAQVWKLKQTVLRAQKAAKL